MMDPSCATPPKWVACYYVDSTQWSNCGTASLGLQVRFPRGKTFQGQPSDDKIDESMTTTPPLHCSTDPLSLHSTQPPQDLKHVRKYWFCRSVVSFAETQSSFPSIWGEEPPVTRFGLLRSKKKMYISASPTPVAPTCQRHMRLPGKPLQWCISSNMQEGKIWADRQLYRGAVPASGWEGRHTNQAPSQPSLSVGINHWMNTASTVTRKKNTSDKSYQTERCINGGLRIMAVVGSCDNSHWERGKKNWLVDLQSMQSSVGQARSLLSPAFGSKEAAPVLWVFFSKTSQALLLNSPCQAGSQGRTQTHYHRDLWESRLHAIHQWPLSRATSQTDKQKRLDRRKKKQNRPTRKVPKKWNDLRPNAAEKLLNQNHSWRRKQDRMDWKTRNLNLAIKVTDLWRRTLWHGTRWHTPLKHMEGNGEQVKTISNQGRHKHKWHMRKDKWTETIGQSVSYFHNKTGNDRTRKNLTMVWQRSSYPQKIIMFIGSTWLGFTLTQTL